jgi:hypothetical protein
MLPGMRLVGLCVIIGGLGLTAGCGSRSRLIAADGGSGGALGGSGGAFGGSGGAFGGSGGAFGGSGGFAGSPFGGAAGTAGCGPIDTGLPCSTLGETSCLTAFPRCAPIYDDTCCSSCKPGPCADCTSWKFFACIDRELSSCVPGMTGPCGQTPAWACKGGTASCASSQCDAVPGCIAAQPINCPEDAPCVPECHSVSAATCGPACEPGPIPLCPPGATAEYAAGSPTGYCIPSTVCSAPPSTCPATMPQGACGVPGQVCTYGSWCKNTCTCQNGVWSCITPPC